MDELAAIGNETIPNVPIPFLIFAALIVLVGAVFATRKKT